MFQTRQTCPTYPWPWRKILITGILLCAGQASRFGSQKLLARLPAPDGRRVVEASAAHLLAAVGQVIAVTSRDDKLMRVLDDCGCQVIINERAAEGMGSSIAAAVVASMVASIAAGMATRADTAGWVIALGDMPYVQHATIATVSQQLAAGPGRNGRDVVQLIDAQPMIVQPTYHGQRGHPVGFAREYGPALAALKGDTGARAVIDAALARDPACVLYVNTDDRGVLADIDMPADLL